MPSRAAFGASVLAGSPATGLAAEPAAGAAILEQLRGFAALGSFLYVAASFSASWSRADSYRKTTHRGEKVGLDSFDPKLFGGQGIGPANEPLHPTRCARG